MSFTDDFPIVASFKYNLCRMEEACFDQKLALFLGTLSQSAKNLQDLQSDLQRTQMRIRKMYFEKRFQNVLHI